MTETLTQSTLAERPPMGWAIAILRAGFAVLLAVGLGAAILRGTHVADLGKRVEPLREAVMHAAGQTEPNPERRAEAIARIDGKFGSHAVATSIHVFAGGLLLVLIPLQFSRFVRSSQPMVHRWNGRLIVLAAWTAGIGGLFFGLLHPFAGTGERVIIAAFGSYFLFAVTLAVARIRAGRVSEHREWMVRAVAGVLGISTVRIVMLPIDLALTPLGVGPEGVFLHSLWTGWLLTLAIAELWIRRSRGVKWDAESQFRKLDKGARNFAWRSLLPYSSSAAP